MRRIIAVLGAVLAAGLLAPVPASAKGNWEETLLDPPPGRVEAGVTYTLGYWILQHGSYPYRDGDLGPTSLVATGHDGETVEFAGTPAPTAGHYVAEVVFPHDGTWYLGSKHGVLMPDPLVATVTVPGGVDIAASQVRDREPYAWGTVRPSFPPVETDAAVAPPAGPPSTAPRGGSGRQAGAARTADPGLPVGLVLAAGAATVGFAAWLARRHARANR